MISLTLFIKHPRKVVSNNEKKSGFKYLLEFAYVMVSPFWPLWASCRGDLLGKPASWSRPGSSNQVLTEKWWRISKPPISEGAQEGRSLVENPAKWRVYRYFTFNAIGVWDLEIEYPIPPYVQLSYIRILTASLILIKTSGIDVTLSDYKTVFVSTRPIKGGKQVEADRTRLLRQQFRFHDRSDYRCWVGFAYMTLDQRILTAALIMPGDLPSLCGSSLPFGRRDVPWRG